MTQLPTLVPYGGVIPDKFTQTAREFADAVHPFMRFYHTDTVPQINDFTTAMNTLSVEIDAVAQQVADDKAAVEAVKQYVSDATNYTGDYDSSMTYAVSQSVTLDELLYVSKIDNNTDAPTPLESSASWLFVGAAQKQVVTVSSDFTTAHNLIVAVDATANHVTVTLPASPSIGDEVEIVDAVGTFSANGVTVGRNGETIMGLDEDMDMTDDNLSVRLVYINNDWRIL